MDQNDEGEGVNSFSKLDTNIESEFKHVFNSGIIRKSEYFDLFISYKRDNGGDHGQRLAIELHEKLTKDGFKVWLDNEEIGFSNNFEQRIEEALLHSKKVACIIGPAWVESPNCRFEVQKAIEFEKRIIPVHYQEFRQLLASKKDEGILSEKEWLRIDRPQEIDFSIKKKYKSSYEDLKSVCNLHDEITLQFNKVLTESYYWEKYNYPKSMLLYGEKLSKIKILRSKCNSDDELPSFNELQDRFMSASDDYVKNEVTDKKKVYIAFTKEEIDYAAELNMELKLQGITTFYDDDFSADSESDGSFIQPILNCETIIDVEVSTFSDGNDLRLNFARSKNKRILKVTNSASVKTRLESKGEKNVHVWNDQVSIDSLVTFINGDKVYNAFHAKLLGQSFDWESSEKSNVKLLGLKEAKLSKDWYVLAEKEGMEPQPSLSMINFVERSVAYAETLRKRKIGLLWTGVFGFVLIVALGAVSWYFGQKANTQSLLADEKTALANEKVKEAELQTKEAKNQKDIAKEQREEAEKQRKEAEKQKDFAASQQKKAKEASDKAKEALEEAKIAKEEADSASNRAEVALAQVEASVKNLEETNEKLELARTEADSISFITRAKKKALKATEHKQAREDSLALASANEAVCLLTDSVKASSQIQSLFSVYTALIPSNSILNLELNRQEITEPQLIFKLNSENELPINKYPEKITNYRINNIPIQIASSNSIVKIELIDAVIDKIESKNSISALCISKDGNKLAIGKKTGSVEIWNLETFQRLDEVLNHSYRITSVAFNKNASQIAVASIDEKFSLVNLTEDGVRDPLSETIKMSNGNRVREIYYWNDNHIITVSWKNYAKIWCTDVRELKATIQR